MKRSWTALAVSFFALGVLAGCNDYNNSVQYPTGATITSISPTGLVAGPAPGTATNCQNTPTGQTNPCFTLYVIGNPSNGFQTSTVVQWNGKSLPACTNSSGVANTSAMHGCTTYIDSVDLSAQIPYGQVLNPGVGYVNTYTPQSGTGQNGLSNVITFYIYGAPNPYPTLSSVSPNTEANCDPSTTSCAKVPITLTGTNFLTTSQNGGSSVTFTGLATYETETAITVTSISSTQLKATIPGSYLCATDTALINVINPPSAICLVNCPNLGGGDTNNPPSGQQATTQTFTITGTAVNNCPAQTPPTAAIAEETPAISQDGRHVAYASMQNGFSQILLRDTCLGAAEDCTASTRTVSITADGSAGNRDSHNPVMTLDGRYVAFSSGATNLAENAPPGRQVYLRDTCFGAPATCKPGNVLVSTDREGKLGRSEAILPLISASGRFVAFLAVSAGPTVAPANVTSGNAVSSSNNSLRQVFVRDTCIGATNCTPKTTLISLEAGGISASASKLANLTVAEETPAITQDGRYVAYASTQNGVAQILLRDTCFGAANACTPSTRILSAAADGSAGNGDSHNAVMTPDGRTVAFSSAATNFVENAAPGRQVYLRDTCIGAPTSCKTGISLGSRDEEGKLAGAEAILPSLNASGRYFAFLAVAPGSATVTPNSGMRQVFVRDACFGAANCTPSTTRISLQPGDGTADTSKPAGPALAGLAKQIALSGGKSSTVFTPTVPIDDRVFLAIPNENR